jgi:hypothetical protein
MLKYVKTFEGFFNKPKPITRKITDQFDILGGYYNLSTDTKALIGKDKDDFFYFFPINDAKQKVIFPAMFISDKTKDGFVSAGEGENFEGFKNFNMKRMTADEVQQYINYEYSCDPSDMPDNW